MMEIVSYGRRAGPASGPATQARPAGPGRPAAPSGAATDASRVAWADCAKGICIVLVVMMHSTLGVEQEYGREGFMHWAVAFARPFRMPDFFLLSGLFLSRVIDRDWRSYADKRVVHFAYFYVLWLVIQSALKFSQTSGGTATGFLTHLAVGLVEPYAMLWFIYLLAAFSIVTKLLRGVPMPILFAAGAALQIMPVSSGSFLLNEFCDRWVYFLAGYLFAPHVFRLAAAARRHPVLALLGLAAWAFGNGVVALAPIEIAGRSHVAELPVVSLVAGLVGAAAIVAFAAVLTRTPLAAPFRYAGENSIAVYLTFFLPMAAVRTVLVKTGIVADAGWAAAIVTLAAILFPLLLERLVRETHLSFLYRRPAWAHIPQRPRPTRLQPAE